MHTKTWARTRGASQWCTGRDVAPGRAVCLAPVLVDLLVLGAHRRKLTRVGDRATRCTVRGRDGGRERRAAGRRGAGVGRVLQALQPARRSAAPRGKPVGG